MCVSCHIYSMTTAQTYKIYDTINKANGFRFVPLLIFSESMEANASCDGGILTVNRGMLSFVRNSDEMAIILGHELGHCLAGDPQSTPEREYRADYRGSIYVAQAGYNVCRGMQVMLRFNDPGSKTHPPSKDRYKRICSRTG